MDTHAHSEHLPWAQATMQSCQTLKIRLEVKNSAHVVPSLGLGHADDHRQNDGLLPLDSPVRDLVKWPGPVLVTPSDRWSDIICCVASPRVMVPRAWRDMNRRSSLGVRSAAHRAPTRPSGCSPLISQAGL